MPIFTLSSSWLLPTFTNTRCSH